MAIESCTGNAVNLGNVVTWLFVVVGWFLVNGHNNRRETRKEIRQALLGLYKLLDDIETDATTYHMGATPDKVLARKIRRDIQQIAGRVHLAQRGKLTFQYSGPLARFRQSITGQNFDDAGFLQKSEADPIFEEIGKAKRTLIQALDSKFNGFYK